MADIPPRSSCSRFYGIFHTPLPGGDSDVAYTSWDWEGHWKNQIDAAASIGANLFVYFGSIQAVPKGTISLQSYLSRRCQIVEYLAAKGMYALSYAAYTFYGWNGVTNTEACDLMARDAQMMAQYENTIGYVTTDEPYGSSVDYGQSMANSTIVSYLADQYAAVRAATNSAFPICTAPNPCGHDSNIWTYSGAAQTRCDNVAPYCDFFCFHPFGFTALSSSDALRAAYPNKQIMMPSSILVENGDPDLGAKVGQVMDLVGSNNFRGMGWFICVDFTGATWGVFNSDLTERTAKTDLFRTKAAGASFYSPSAARSVGGVNGKPVFSA